MLMQGKWRGPRIGTGEGHCFYVDPLGMEDPIPGPDNQYLVIQKTQLSPIAIHDGFILILEQGVEYFFTLLS